MKIKKIILLPRRWTVPENYPGPQCPPSDRGHGPRVPYSDASEVVDSLGPMLLSLQELVSDSDRTRYLSPLQVAVGHAEGVLSATSPSSPEAIDEIWNVIDQLEAAQPLIDRLATINDAAIYANELVAAKAALEKMVRR